MTVSILDTTSLTDPALFASWYAKMPAWRRRKIDGMKHESGKCLSLGVGILLHKALADIGITNEPDEAELNQYEKPYYKEYPNVHFSLSHSGKMAMCAVADAPVGCDVEKIKNKNCDIAERFFAVDENALLKSIADETAQKEMFFRLWTLKESFIKCIGTGLSTPLNEFSIIPEQDRITLNQSINNCQYRFVEIEFDDGYRYSTCLKYE